MRSFLFGLFLFGYTYTWAQPAPAVKRNFFSDSLDRYISTAMAEWKIPGLSVAIVQNGAVRWVKGYGVLETGGTAKVDPDTRFGIGSNTKAFTATALAMLEADGKLSLNDSVVKWVSDFRQYDPWVTQHATVRDLLCHRLGFLTFQGDFMYFDSDLTYAEVKERFGRLKPLFGFRARWGYTNAAFGVAGEVVEKASGLSWGRFLQERIFQPLDMRNTLPYSAGLDTARNMAKAHTVVEGVLKKIPYGRIDNIAAAGSISSSVRDMSNWALTQLQNGQWKGKEVIPERAISGTRVPQSILGNGGSEFNRSHFALYGLGWFLREYESRLVVEHTGGVNGFVSSFRLLPEEKAAVVVLTNTDANGFYEALCNEITDALLSLPYRNYSKQALDNYREQTAEDSRLLKARRDTVAMKIPPSLPLAAFAGTYRHSLYGTMSLRLEKDKLVASFEHHKGRYAILEPLGGDRFLAVFNDPLYGNRVWPFTIRNQQVQSVNVNVNGFVEYTSYDFEKINP